MCADLQAFDMYTSNPLEGNAYGGVPPAKPTPEWKELQMARQRVGLMLVAHAKAQPQALLPHLAALANKIQEMWAAGVIGTNEQSTLFDVILAAAAGADIQLQKQVHCLTLQVAVRTMYMQCLRTRFVWRLSKHCVALFVSFMACVQPVDHLVVVVSMVAMIKEQTM